MGELFHDHIVHFKYIRILVVNSTSIKMKKKAKYILKNEAHTLPCDCLKQDENMSMQRFIHKCCISYIHNKQF